MKTKALISCMVALQLNCALVFEYTKSRVTGDADQIKTRQITRLDGQCIVCTVHFIGLVMQGIINFNL